ncbi:restriction endonuclease subunit S [Candidatus Accumulibacter aalborgensis]|uniref:restriction endonuclease subunit S n=1 Tax=Candidatus Accumulibacter aalborgensis TaxID=1860102 RepID=UPI001FDEF4C9
MGQSPESVHYNNEGTGLPFFQGKSEFGERYPEVRKWCSDPKKIAEPGDILLSIRAPVGPTNIAQERACIGRGLAAIGAEKPASPLYLFYFFRQLEPWLSKQGTGTTFAAIGGEFLRAVELPIAPVAEQTRIVEKLEELLSDLDAGVAELKAAQKKLTKYRQSVLKAAVEGALTADWRAQRTQQGEAFETGAELLERILRERRACWEAKQLAKLKEQGKAPPKDWQDNYPEPNQPTGHGLPELPEDWLWSSVGQCFHVAVGATPSRKEPSYWNGTIPWVSSGEVHFSRIKATKERISELGLKNSSTGINPTGSVMLGMIGEGRTRGQVAILDIEAANNQNCAAIRVSETDVPAEYVYYWLWSRYEETRRGSSGNNQPALNKSIVERIPIPIAPPMELKVIVGLVEVLLSQIESQEAAIAVSLKQASAQRQNILTSAFSGQLVPQDPTDEPASKLLERIRAERMAKSAQLPTKNPRRRKAAVETDSHNDA